jgi:MurNAc alpha-1-phosphate uridylyltransferase
VIGMILSAGRGERLRPLTDATPKPLMEVGGTSLIEHHLARLRRGGADTVVVNLGWLGEQIAARIGSGAAYGVQVVYSPEYDNILETGGGIRRALPMLGEDPFWVINGDICTDYALPSLQLEPDSLGHLVLVPTPVYKPDGDFDLVGGRVRNGPRPAYTFSGIAMYRPEMFTDRPAERFPLAPLLRAAADRGRLSGELYAGRWADAGTPDRLGELRAALARA